MMYFIESVTTLTSTGKSRKGALLQTVVKPIEHTLLKGDAAVVILVKYLQALVDKCNSSFRGNTVYLHFNPESFHIYACGEKTGSEAYIFSISYAPVKEQFFFYDLPGAILSPIENVCGRDFAQEVDDAVDMTKGGAR